MRAGDRLAMIPVSLSGGVEPGARTGTSVSGQAVVVWRGQDGRVRAWEDWCPHRGMRLSFGFVRGSRLTCIYHGWSFGASGQCLSIPAHPAMTPSPKITARPLPVAETLGMIWVGDGPLPGPPEDELVYPVRSITVPAPAAALRGALDGSLPPGTEIAETRGGLVMFKGRRFRVLAGIQDRGDGTATAHIVTSGPGASGRKVLAAWAADVRDRLEAAVP
jgi:nitrite reductase/ring-hydroxylating ferredoxin subunit